MMVPEKTTRPSVPDFIGIGPGKAGSTWLYRLLQAHPEICMSKAKEPLYFQQHKRRSIDWYRHFWSHAKEGQVTGEVSNTYLADSEVPRRIYEYRPTIRLVSMVRNPVERAFSHYLYLLRNGASYASFGEALDSEPALIDKGMYARHLSHYLQYFPSAQLLILLFDDLKVDARDVARRIFSFLGVDEGVIPDGSERKVFGAAQPRVRVVARAVKSAADLVRSAGFPEIVTRVKRSFVPQVAYRAYSKADYPQMDNSTRSELEMAFADDVSGLGKLIDRDLRGMWFRTE